MIGTTGAFAYASGSIGYDISYPQCGIYPSGAAAGRASPGPARFTAGRAGQVLSAYGLVQSAFQPRTAPPSSGSSTFRTRNGTLAFGIIGVDGGRPFNSPNPCLASEYASAPSPAVYINTGYDPSYVSKYTTPSCAVPSTSSDQQKAYAVGCSEAQDDYGYAQSKGIANPVAWWLDVETANSWCGLHGVTCDISLNQYTIQGIIDTFSHIGAVPIGIYSNKTMWSAIVGSPTITGASADWVASGQSTPRQAAAYCNSSSSFSGSPVTIVQFVYNSADRDYAC